MRLRSYWSDIHAHCTHIVHHGYYMGHRYLFVHFIRLRIIVIAIQHIVGSLRNEREKNIKWNKIHRNSVCFEIWKAKHCNRTRFNFEYYTILMRAAKHKATKSIPSNQFLDFVNCLFIRNDATSSTKNTQYTFTPCIHYYYETHFGWLLVAS